MKLRPLVLLIAEALAAPSFKPGRWRCETYSPYDLHGCVTTGDSVLPNREPLVVGVCFTRAHIGSEQLDAVIAEGSRIVVAEQRPRRQGEAECSRFLSCEPWRRGSAP